MRYRYALILSLALGTGCAGFGPGTLTHDRMNYAASLGESLKNQALSNIVKLRYVETPVFVDVGQIVGSYSLEGDLSGGATLTRPNGANVYSLGAGARFADKPTITYTPLMGKDFMKGVLSPLPPEAIFFLLEMGWRAKDVLPLCVNAVNSHSNRRGAGPSARAMDPEFERIVDLFQQLQSSGTLGLRVRQNKEKSQSLLLFFRTANATEETRKVMAELLKLLGLKEGLSEYRLSYGSAATDDGEIAVQTRSLLQIMIQQSQDVDVPPEHAASTFPPPPNRSDADRLLHIKSSSSAPSDAHAAIEYRGWWFYIDDTDLKSKLTFAMTILIFNFADVEQKQSLPLITISNQ